MTTRIHQSTPIPIGRGVKVNNNFPKKRIRINKLPLGSTVRVDKSFTKPQSLKGRMSKIKASPKYKQGEAKVRSKLASRRIKNRGKVTVKVSTS